jgi:gliding motility-associated-like protein
MIKLCTRIWLIFLVLFCTKQNAYAVHIAGGEIQYEVVSSTDTTVTYRITMRLLRDCNSTGAALNGETVTIGIYNSSTSIRENTVGLTQLFSLPVPTIQNTPGANPCLTGNPTACYQVGTFSGQITLRKNAVGYILTWTRYTRQLLTNVSVNPQLTGAVFTTQIPGSNALPIGLNNSPVFSTKDTTIVCKNSNFRLDFSAVDKDGDSLAYKFVSGLDGNAGDNPQNNPNPLPANNFSPFPLNYIAPFSGSQPLGTGVTINVRTGLISGVAPAPGSYVICVVAEEWRDGKLINNHRKDFILNVNDCSLAGADLKPSYINCKDFTFTFSNESTATNISKYLWIFDNRNPLSDTSQQPQPVYTYKDTGIYTLKLVVEAVGGCRDSATTEVRVFPGFVPNFSFTGGCITNPIVFRDLSTTVYGTVNFWRWDFGQTTTTADTSRIQNPQFVYPTIGNKNVSLIISTNRGCIDTLTRVVNVFDRPSLQLPFKDTLICSIDSLQLRANGTGNFTWTPNAFIFNRTISNPTVYPKDTITYFVQLEIDGCISNDSVRVNVLDFITVNLGPDTTICATDAITLFTISDALSYRWTTNSNEVVQNIKQPLVRPLTTTNYTVTANLGKCQDTDNITITPIPYPSISANNESICFGNRIQLNASIVASSFSWQPSNSLINTNTLQPIAGPSRTTNYFLTVRDTLGCPKPVTDTITVNVIPPIVVNAGNDTSVVVNQPLQFNALSSVTNNVQYNWSPNIGLNNNSIANPIGIYNGSIDSIPYLVTVTTPEGCVGTDNIVVRIFRTEPDIFVPSAFTPNNDGLNDVIKPIPVGITNLNYFSIYNRLGQLVFTTNQLNRGWNGNINGTPQASGTFVYQVQAVDYTGKTIYKKGTIVLIR